MPTYTLTLVDAKVPAIVRRALADAVASDDAMPRVTFGSPRPRVCASLLASGAWWIMDSGGYGWGPLTNEQAVARITRLAHGYDVSVA